MWSFDANSREDLRASVPLLNSEQEPTKDFPLSEENIFGFPRRLMNLRMQLIVESAERLAEISK